MVSHAAMLCLVGRASIEGSAFVLSFGVDVAMAVAVKLSFMVAVQILPVFCPL